MLLNIADSVKFGRLHHAAAVNHALESRFNALRDDATTLLSHYSLHARQRAFASGYPASAELGDAGTGVVRVLSPGSAACGGNQSQPRDASVAGDEFRPGPAVPSRAAMRASRA